MQSNSIIPRAIPRQSVAISQESPRISFAFFGKEITPVARRSQNAACSPDQAPPEGQIGMVEQPLAIPYGENLQVEACSNKARCKRNRMVTVRDIP